MTVYFGVHEDGIEKSYVFLTRESFFTELAKPGNALPRYDARMDWNTAETGDKERFTYFSGAVAYICWQAFLSHTKPDRTEVYVYFAPQLLKFCYTADIRESEGQHQKTFVCFLQLFSAEAR